MTPPRERTRPGFLESFLRRPPRQSRSVALVDAVIAAFDELVKKAKDESSVRLEETLSRAGVGAGSFHEYFGNKDGLFGAFVARATEENFQKILDAVDATPLHPFEPRVQAVSRAVTVAYLEHPQRTRLLVGIIVRLGLLGIIVAERDRFSAALAARAHQSLPSEDLRALEATMRMVSDATMGLVVSELHRHPPRSVDETAPELFELALVLIRARHAV